MTWELKSDRPIYLQLVEQIELKIVSECYQAGDRLPSVRDMAQEAEVNPNTMQRALSELERMGLIITQRTNGKFITEDKNVIDTIKTNLAAEQIKEFLAAMQKLGYEKKDVITLIEEVAKEDIK